MADGRDRVSDALEQGRTILRRKKKRCGYGERERDRRKFELRGLLIGVREVFEPAIYLDEEICSMRLKEVLERALRSVRIGDYADAAEVLPPVEGVLDREQFVLRERSEGEQVLLLRLMTLSSEIADHFGDYTRAERLLLPQIGIIDDVKEASGGTAKLRFRDLRGVEWKLLRGQLYYLWQLSVLRYRRSRYLESAELLSLARGVAERMDPAAHGLLTQVYYGSAKIALHESDFQRATVMYRKSLVSASDALSYCRLKGEDGVLSHETEAAQYSIGKALALGLGQCLREQGRLEEAHMAVVAGKLLLDLGRDTDLSHHAWLLLGSIERGTAGRKDQNLLRSARKHLETCANYFATHKGDVWYRSRYELALVLMQQKHLDEARRGMTAVLYAAKEREYDKWIANAQIGLSRIERRSGAHQKAVDDARGARKTTRDKTLRKIDTRARMTLAHALYQAAVATKTPDFNLLREAESELNRAANHIDTRDLRNRAMLLLLQARVFNARRDERAAVEAYHEYQTIEYFVDVGRIRELGQDVRDELYPSLTKLHSPIDATVPVWNAEENLDAMRRHLVVKVDKLPARTDDEKARLLGISRATLNRLRLKFGLSDSAAEPRKAKPGVATRRRPRRPRG